MVNIRLPPLLMHKVSWPFQPGSYPDLVRLHAGRVHRLGGGDGGNGNDGYAVQEIEDFISRHPSRLGKQSCYCIIHLSERRPLIMAPIREHREMEYGIEASGSSKVCQMVQPGMHIILCCRLSSIALRSTLTSAKTVSSVHHVV